MTDCPHHYRPAAGAASAWFCVHCGEPRGNDAIESPTVARKNDAIRHVGGGPCEESKHNWTPWIGSERCTLCGFHRNVPSKHRTAEQVMIDLLEDLRRAR